MFWGKNFFFKKKALWPLFWIEFVSLKYVEPRQGNRLTTQFPEVPGTPSTHLVMNDLERFETPYFC